MMRMVNGWPSLTNLACTTGSDVSGSRLPHFPHLSSITLHQSTVENAQLMLMANHDTLTSLVHLSSIPYLSKKDAFTTMMRSLNRALQSLMLSDLSISKEDRSTSQHTIGMELALMTNLRRVSLIDCAPWSTHQLLSLKPLAANGTLRHFSIRCEEHSGILALASMFGDTLITFVTDIEGPLLCRLDQWLPQMKYVQQLALGPRIIVGNYQARIRGMDNNSVVATTSSTWHQNRDQVKATNKKVGSNNDGKEDIKQNDITTLVNHPSLRRIALSHELHIPISSCRYWNIEVIQWNDSGAIGGTKGIPADPFD
jgi:hypothetical protein